MPFSRALRFIHSLGEENTPLHYAARAGCQEAVMLLLDRGSYIGHMNKLNKPPIADIPSHMLLRYFDKCLEKRTDRVNQYAIEFNYRCLMPHDDPKETNRTTREMEMFKYIANDAGLKYLLKHPLLSSFLYLKWHTIRHLLYANLIFYMIFYSMLNAYILTCNAPMKNATSYKLSEEAYGPYRNNFLQAVTVIMLLLLILREVHQFASCIKCYLESLKNWLEIALIVFTVVWLCGARPEVGAIIILLSACELMVLISQHPHLSISIEIFQTVSFNFIRFLFPYFFLIFAFALAFHMLVTEPDKQPDNFSNPGLSLFKTVIMLTGEFDAGNISFILYPVWTHVTFTLFIFFIVIVLLNLLNGLAVSNTTEILAKTELIRLISRTRLIAYIEDIVIVEPFRRHYYSLNSRLLQWNPFGFLTKKILLFPHILWNGKIKLGDNGQYVRCTHTDESKQHDKRWFSLKMDPYTIKEAKRIINDKNQNKMRRGS